MIFIHTFFAFPSERYFLLCIAMEVWNTDALPKPTPHLIKKEADPISKA
jgi:hypothetical protein